MLVTTGTVQATATPAPIRLSILRREIRCPSRSVSIFLVAYPATLAPFLEGSRGRWQFTPQQSTQAACPQPTARPHCWVPGQSLDLLHGRTHSQSTKFWAQMHWPSTLRTATQPIPP